MSHRSSPSTPPPAKWALLSAAASAALLPLPAVAQSSSDCLDAFIEAKMDQGDMPGLAASILRNGEVVWARGYGLANVELGVPVTVDTPFFLASVSKAVTGVALMQQRELGSFELDDDIDDYLGFPVDNPDHPDAPITFRHVLTHTSSIRDNWAFMDPLYGPGDSPLALADYLPEYLVPGGEHYDADANYYPWRPGSTYAYCNQGFALAGLLVETVAGGQSFDAYCRDAIFEPLGMDDTGFRLSDFDDPDTLAMPYFWNGDEYVPYGHYGYPDYPAGTLRSSILDLSRFLLALENDGTYGGVEILSPGATVEMKTVQFPTVDPSQGLALYYIGLNGMTLLGHDGGDPGVLTDMYTRPSDDVGVILLTNGEADFDAYYSIFERLWLFADKVSSEVVRAGSPPNPDAFREGVTSGPVLGQTWDPVVDHAAFVPDAVSDFVVVTGGPANLDLGAPGTFLCDLGAPPLVTATAAPGTPFALPVPDACALIGAQLTAQGGSVDRSLAPQLANALDVTVGVFAGSGG